MFERKGTAPTLLACAFIACAAVGAYWNSFSAPFVFDAAAIIANNPTIRHLGTAWHPPHDGSTVDGRPLLNFSLAVNYAISGTDVWSYHALNLAIHVAAAWLLFGIVRRTVLESGKRKSESGEAKSESGNRKSESAVDPTWVAFVIALLWALHPLQTESVTYIVQRAESLVGLFYLLTLYCFIRSVELEEAADRRPFPLSAFRLSLFIACLCGVASKEIIVTVPVIVFLYDRTFLAGSFREAWRLRRGTYLALAATWIPLAFIVLGSASRNGTAGFGVKLPWSDYALTQVYAVPHYLRLALWPHPLVFDYGTATITGGTLLLPAIVLIGLLAGTAIGLCSSGFCARVGGFLGACFFVILAPTSLVPVATQTIAEHRMYLPLAAVVTGFVLLIGKFFSLPGSGFQFPFSAFRFPLSAFLLLCLGAATHARNTAYASEMALWTDTVAKRPDNDRAHNNLANALYLTGRIPDAAREYSEALRLHPDDNAEVQYNLGNCLLQEGRFAEAAARFSEAARLAPENADAQNNLGNALAQSGQLQAALGHFQAALRLDPYRPDTHTNLGNVLFLLGRRDLAIAEYQTALQIDPHYADASAALGHLQAQGPASGR